MCNIPPAYRKSDQMLTRKITRERRVTLALRDRHGNSVYFTLFFSITDERSLHYDHLEESSMLRGSFTVKVVPVPTSLSTRIVPLYFLTIS